MTAMRDALASSLLGEAAAEADDGSWSSELRDMLLAEVPGLFDALSGRGPVAMSAYALRTWHRDPTSIADLADDRPFRWAPLLARRSIARLALRALGAAPPLGPAGAVAEVLASAVRETDSGDVREGSWSAWYTALPPGAQSVVQAVATTWTTQVVESLAWEKLGAGVDLTSASDRWQCPARRPLLLRSTIDARVAVAGALGGGGTDGARRSDHALVVVGGGAPDPTGKSELAFHALVTTLTRNRAPVRVLGLWPEAGAHVTLEVSRADLHAAAIDVVAAARAVASSSASNR